MKVALLTTDSREHYADYSNALPYFGSAPTALLQGFVALSEDVEVHVISCLRRPIGSRIRLSENVFYHGLHVPPWGWLKTGYQGCIRAVRGRLREIQPDIVHGQGTERDCGLSAILSGFPNVITIHGNMRAMAKVSRAGSATFYWLAALLEDFALRRTYGVLCNSAYTEELVRPRTRKTWSIPNPVDRLFLETIKTQNRNAVPVLLNVGTIAPHKRQIEILEVARILSREGYRFQLQFIGGLDAGTEYGANFSARIAEAECAGFSSYLGMKSSEELVRLIDAADALVHFPREEAFGLVVAEALSRNLKFFGAKTGGIPDIAKDVELAELYGPDDWQGLSEGIINWLKAGFPKPRTAGEVMNSRYHPTPIGRRHLQIYREALNSEQ